jgi:hypothetical protein
METLICQSCESGWDRPRVRGRKPKFCPACVSSPVEPAPAPKKAGVDKRSVEYYIEHYGYKPPKQSTYCSGNMHKVCKDVLYDENVSYPCRCKCHD